MSHLPLATDLTQFVNSTTVKRKQGVSTKHVIRRQYLRFSQYLECQTKVLMDHVAVDAVKLILDVIGSGQLVDTTLQRKTPWRTGNDGNWMNEVLYALIAMSLNQ